VFRLPCYDPGLSPVDLPMPLQLNGMPGKWQSPTGNSLLLTGPVGKLEPLVVEPALTFHPIITGREKVLIVLAPICGAVSKGFLLKEPVPRATGRVFSEKISVIGAFSLRKSHPIYDFTEFFGSLLLTNASSYLIFIFIVCISYPCLDYLYHWFLTGNGKKLQLKC
jgi:hypothetical protein